MLYQPLGVSIVDENPLNQATLRNSGDFVGCGSMGFELLIVSRVIIISCPVIGIYFSQAGASYTFVPRLVPPLLFCGLSWLSPFRDMVD